MRKVTGALETQTQNHDITQFSTSLTYVRVKAHVCRIQQDFYLECWRNNFNYLEVVGNLIDCFVNISHKIVTPTL